MEGRSEPVVLVDGQWTAAFEELNERGGGVIYVPAGVHTCGPTTIDLAAYPRVTDAVAIRGEGLGASIVHVGQGADDGLSIIDSEGTHHFYLELTGITIEGSRDGVLFRLGRDDFADAYNSCRLHLGTNNGAADGTAACRLNHVLNTRHFGVHNAEGGTALEHRQVQFGGLTGSASSRRGVSFELSGHSFANVVEWLNVEACQDGVVLSGDDATINRFGMLYGANVAGTLWRHEAPVKSRIDAAFVGDEVTTIDERTAGEYSVGVSNKPFTHAMEQ